MAAFVASRAAYYAAGVRFDTRPIGDWQLLDGPLLQNDLGRSLWYLHMQPPLFNGYVGLVLKLPHVLERPAFVATYVALGLVLSVSLYFLMRELDVPEWIAFAVSVLFTAGPAAVLYENWLFYTYPVAAGLVVSGLLLLRWARTGRTQYGVGFFAVTSAVVLTRSTYHLLLAAGDHRPGAGFPAESPAGPRGCCYSPGARDGVVRQEPDPLRHLLQ